MFALSAYFDLGNRPTTYKKGLKNPYKKNQTLTWDKLPLKYNIVIKNYKFPDQKNMIFMNTLIILNC